MYTTFIALHALNVNTIYFYTKYIFYTKVKIVKDKKLKLDCHYACPVELSLALIGGKWRGLILYHLLDGTLRFNELRRKIPSITQRMLTMQLRELEKVGLIYRKVYAQVPPKVEYSLTEEGKTLRKILKSLRDWGADYMKKYLSDED